MEEIKMYKTSDGLTFDSPEAAQKHEFKLKNSERVEKFLDSHYPLAAEGTKQGPSRSMARKAVEQFLEGGF